MTQADRDRLVALKKAKRKLISQGEAAEELGLGIRQVQRLLDGLKERGDKAVVHGLRGKPSNRRIEEKIERQAVKILSAPVDRKSTRLNSSHLGISYAVFCLKK